MENRAVFTTTSGDLPSVRLIDFDTLKNKISNLSATEKSEYQMEISGKVKKDDVFYIKPTYDPTDLHITIHKNTWNDCGMIHATFYFYNHKLHKQDECSAYYITKINKDGNVVVEFDETFIYEQSGKIVPSCDARFSEKKECYDTHQLRTFIEHFSKYIKKLYDENKTEYFKNELIKCKTTEKLLRKMLYDYQHSATSSFGYKKRTREETTDEIDLSNDSQNSAISSFGYGKRNRTEPDYPKSDHQNGGYYVKYVRYLKKNNRLLQLINTSKEHH